MTKEKIKVIINVYNTEEGYQIYKVEQANGSGYQADCCGDSGFFWNSSTVDEYMDDWREHYDIEIVEDYR
tara:strand:- start:9 stop:218 length:210 start_codon:yes stop_codon:yes gene_type:complete